KRKVGLVAQTIVRNAGNAGLPRRLGISLARSADHTGDGRLSGEAGAWSAAAAHRKFEFSPEFRVTESGWTIRLRVTADHGIGVKELAGATIVPGNLRNIRERGCLGLGIVGGAPVVADGNAVDVLIVLGHE